MDSAMRRPSGYKTESATTLSRLTEQLAGSSNTQDPIIRQMNLEQPLTAKFRVDGLWGAQPCRLPISLVLPRLRNEK